MSEDHGQVETTGHVYDGIEEYDNPVPGWWHVLWFLSFVLLIVYLPAQMISPYFPTPKRQLEAAQEAEFERLFADIGQLENDEATLVTYMNDPDWMSFAASTFRGNCASCHAADGGGLIGVNLTDDAYKNVETITDIHGILVDGAAAGAMPAWGNRLNSNELVLLSAYVASLRGTTPAAGTAAEGEVIPEWPTMPDDAS